MTKDIHFTVGMGHFDGNFFVVINLNGAVVNFSPDVARSYAESILRWCMEVEGLEEEREAQAQGGDTE